MEARSDIRQFACRCAVRRGDDAGPARHGARRPRQPIGNRLAIAPTLVPEDPRQLRASLARLNELGGLMRVVNVYAAQDDPTSSANREAWNPDGRTGGTSDWYLFFAGLGAGVVTDINNAAR